MADAQIEKTYPLSYVIGSLLAGLLVGTLIAFAWFSTDTTSRKGVIETRSGTDVYVDSVSEETTTESTSSTESTIETQTPTETSPSNGGKLSIADQTAGVSVQIAHAEVSQDQWVVIHEERAGNPGNVLGAARFMPGTTSGEVTLLRGTVANSRYFGVIYQDNGDRTFSLESDMPLRDAEGNIILVTFTAR